MHDPEKRVPEYELTTSRETQYFYAFSIYLIGEIAIIAASIPASDVRSNRRRSGNDATHAILDDWKNNLKISALAKIPGLILVCNDENAASTV
jgi:hypothetical protein